MSSRRPLVWFRDTDRFGSASGAGPEPVRNEMRGTERWIRGSRSGRSRRVHETPV